ncbi:MAG TPA: hypothetical protein VNB49_02880 [Candidatus Dormibacteraeota bacterium]|nr:hypothetical protein [Candidatus Dormibacteraeota bacterium]
MAIQSGRRDSVTTAGLGVQQRSRLAHGFFAADVSGHEDFDGDAPACPPQIVDVNRFAERLAIERALGESEYGKVVRTRMPSIYEPFLDAKFNQAKEKRATGKGLKLHSLQKIGYLTGGWRTVTLPMLLFRRGSTQKTGVNRDLWPTLRSR